MFVLLLLIIVRPISTKSLDIDDMRAIQRAMHEVERNERNATQALGPDRQCYPDLGCFSTDGLMAHTSRLPESPEAIGTKYYCYNHADNPSEFNELDPHDLTTLIQVPTDRSVAVLVHGWRNNASHPNMLALKDSLLISGGVGAVIAVDWNTGY